MSVRYLRHMKMRNRSTMRCTFNIDKRQVSLRLIYNDWKQYLAHGYADANTFCRSACADYNVAMNTYLRAARRNNGLIISRLHHNLRIVPIDDFASSTLLLLSNLWGHLVIWRVASKISDSHNLRRPSRVNLINLNRECIHRARQYIRKLNEARNWQFVKRRITNS